MNESAETSNASKQRLDKTEHNQNKATQHHDKNENKDKTDKERSKMKTNLKQTLKQPRAERKTSVESENNS